MTTYEVIDAICDAVNPVLFLSALGMVGYFLLKKKYKYSASIGVGIVFGLFVTYGMLFVDTKMQIWESMGMDYSTHTAFAFAMCSVLGVFLNRPVVIAVILCGYIAAMLYQKYHTVSDISTTLLVLAVLVLPFHIQLKRISERTRSLHIKNSM